MKASRSGYNVILIDSSPEPIERLTPEEALELSSDLAREADAVLQAIAKNGDNKDEDVQWSENVALRGGAFKTRPGYKIIPHHE